MLIWCLQPDAMSDAAGAHPFRYVVMRAAMKPYIAELSANVTATGVPTMRPLWYEFPEDHGAYGINDQYFLGPKYLVAPVRGNFDIISGPSFSFSF